MLKSLAHLAVAASLSPELVLSCFQLSSVDVPSAQDQTSFDCD